VDFVVIGGFAAAAQGVPHTTPDIDICYAADSANLTRIIAALAPLHPRPKSPGLTDSVALRLPFRWDTRALKNSPMLSLQTDGGPLDLLDKVKGIGIFSKVRAAATVLQLGDLQILVLDLEPLLLSKQAAGREKDLRLIPEIEAALRLRMLEHGAAEQPQASSTPDKPQASRERQDARDGRS
jgi:hypothetical protein